MIKLPVIFQDQDILVIDKPAGIVSTPSDTSSEPTMADSCVTIQI